MSLYAPKEKKKKEKPTDDVQGTPSGFEYGLNFGCINGCSISLKSDGWVGGNVRTTSQTYRTTERIYENL